MTVKGFLEDLWLAFGVLGIAIGLAAEEIRGDKTT